MDSNKPKPRETSPLFRKMKPDKQKESPLNYTMAPATNNSSGNQNNTPSTEVQKKVYSSTNPFNTQPPPATQKNITNQKKEWSPGNPFAQPEGTSAQNKHKTSSAAANQSSHQKTPWDGLIAMAESSGTATETDGTPALGGTNQCGIWGLRLNSNKKWETLFTSPTTQTQPSHQLDKTPLP